MKQIIRKTWVLLLGALAFVSCEKDTETPAPVPPAFSLKSASDYQIEAGGRRFEIRLNTNYSASELNFESDSEWLSTGEPTATDMTMTFVVTVDANDTGLERTGTVTVSVLDTEAGFEPVTITVTQGYSMLLELVSAAEVAQTNLGGEFEIELKTNHETGELTLAASDTWLTLGEAVKDGLKVTIPVTVSANENYEPREGSIEVSVSGSDLAPLTVAVSQEEAVKFSLLLEEYEAEAEGGEFTVGVDTNVEYEVSSDSEWVTLKSKSSTEAVLVVGELNEELTREAVVTFTQTSGPLTDGEYLSLTVTVTQTYVDPTKGIASYIDFSKNYAYPAAWNNADVLNGLDEFTVETYVHLKEGAKLAGWSFSMPIFCARNTAAMAFFQAAMGTNVPMVIMAGSHTTYTNSTAAYTGGTDMHMAMTVASDGSYTLYVDGNAVISGKKTGGAAPYSFAKESGTYESGDCLYLGYMASKTRDTSSTYFQSIAGEGMGTSAASASLFQLVQGSLAEVRIWNRQLSTEEINAEGHFYMVSPDSDGLLAYWKCNEKSGTTLKDSTGNGNDLTLYEEITVLAE